MNGHILIIEQRNTVRASMVKKAERFSDTQVLVYTECGDLLIKGCGLEVESCCTDCGDIEVKGKIDSVSYLSDGCHIPDNILSRIFK